MITIEILAAWFMLSAIIFILFTSIPFLEEAMDEYRSANTAMIILSQGLAATLFALGQRALY